MEWHGLRAAVTVTNCAVSDPSVRWMLRRWQLFHILPKLSACQVSQTLAPVCVPQVGLYGWLVWFSWWKSQDKPMPEAQCFVPAAREHRTLMHSDAQAVSSGLVMSHTEEWVIQTLPGYKQRWRWWYLQMSAVKSEKASQSPACCLALVFSTLLIFHKSAERLLRQSF